VTGSTALGERLDPERMRRLMRSYFESAREILERHGGSVEKFIGDAVMAVFGVPIVHEDDALRACRAALEIAESLRRLNARLEEEQGFTIEIRTGVNTGQVVAEEAADSDALVVGDAVNVAARLEQAAAPGEILIGASTFRLVRDFVAAEPVDAMALRGKSTPVAAYRLTGLARDVEAMPRRLVSPLVGREREIEMLRQAFERATAERTLQLFTVLGQAGVGKSRLIQEFLAAIGDEHAVLRGRCLPYGEGLTYLPMVAALRRAAGIADDDSADEALSKLSAVVEGEPDGEVICRLVQQLLGLAKPSASQEDLFWAVRRFLESLASRRALVVVIDDIHWAEPTLLDLIEHLADWSRDAAILLIATARPDLLEERPAWGGGKMNAASVLLEPLPTSAAGLLIDNLVGDRTLPDAVHAEIVNAAEGNPLFVEEMLGMLVDDGVLRAVDGGWEVTRDVARLDVPPTIQALLAARLDRLSASEREVAQIAAVVGRVFDRPTVEALLAEPERAGVGRQIMALVRKDLVRPERSKSPGVDTFRFRHALIRDATYDSLSKEDRSRLHTAVAARLAGVGGEVATDVSELQGYHLEQAHRYRVELGLGGEATDALARQAAERLAAAGLTAAARSDVPATVGLLRRASALLPPPDPTRLRLLLELAVAEGEADPDQAAALVREALDHAQASGEEALIAHVLVQGRLNGFLSPEELGFDDRIACDEAIAQRAFAAFGATGDDLGLSRAWRLLGEIHTQRGRIADEEAALETALSHARQAGDVREQVESIFELSFTLTQGPTPIPDGIRRCMETLEQYPGILSIEGWMTHALAHLRVRLGEFDEAIALARRTRQILLETGQELSHAFMCEVEGDVLAVAGRVEEAAEVMRDGYRRAEARGVRNAIVAAFLARRLCAAGQYEDAEPMAKAGMDGPPGFAAVARAQLARVRAHGGDHDEAVKLADEACGWFSGTDWLFCAADANVDRAEVMRLAGRPDDERAALRLALDLYRRKGNLVQAAAVERGLAKTSSDSSLTRAP